jgi:DNA-directed RNA polymerase sigma subunit (sigma70/sigma32)
MEARKVRSLMGTPLCTYEEVAKLFGVTRQAIEQAELRALSKVIFHVKKLKINTGYEL